MFRRIYKAIRNVFKCKTKDSEISAATDAEVRPKEKKKKKTLFRKIFQSDKEVKPEVKETPIRQDEILPECPKPEPELKEPNRLKELLLDSDTDSDCVSEVSWSESIGSLLDLAGNTWLSDEEEEASPEDSVSLRSERKGSSDSNPENNLVQTFRDSRETSLEVIDLSYGFSEEAGIGSPECPVSTTPEEIVSAMSVGAGNILPLQEVHSVETSDSLKDEPSADVMNIIFVQEAKEPAVCPKPQISEKHPIALLGRHVPLMDKMNKVDVSRLALQPPPIEKDDPIPPIMDTMGQRLKMHLANLKQASSLECSLPDLNYMNMQKWSSEMSEVSSGLSSNESEMQVGNQDSPEMAQILDQQRPSVPVKDYKKCKWLGTGSFGNVFLAKHVGTGTMVAVKAINKANVPENMMPCLKTEISTLKLAQKEKTPFLVWLFSAFQSEHHVLLAMEFASGGTLASHVRAGLLPLERSRFYGACIILGVQFLHNNNIIHRDLKPENILIDGTGYAKLADFGISVAVHDPNGKIRGRAGTRCFIAPEMYMNNVYDRCADWWAVGVIMFEMLVGKLPFNGITNEDLIEEIIKASPVYPPDLDRAAKRLLQGLLTKNVLFRLGGNTYNVKTIQQQCFFKTIDWEALAKKQVEAPFIPRPSLDFFTAEEELVLTSTYSRFPISEEIQGQFQELFKHAE